MPLDANDPRCVLVRQACEMAKRYLLDAVDAPTCDLIPGLYETESILRQTYKAIETAVVVNQLRRGVVPRRRRSAIRAATAMLRAKDPADARAHAEGED